MCILFLDFPLNTLISFEAYTFQKGKFGEMSTSTHSNQSHKAYAITLKCIIGGSYRTNIESSTRLESSASLDG